jgi:hypothetical protein
MIPMDFGVFGLSIYAFITGVRKREEKSGYDRKNFLSAPLPPATVRCKPLLWCYLMPFTWIFSGSEEEPEKNAQDVAQHIQCRCSQQDHHAHSNKHGL